MEQPTRTEWCCNGPGGARNIGTQSRWGSSRSSNLNRPPDVVEGPHADEDEPSDGTGVLLTSSVIVGLESLDEVS